jgi:hypothetical protein
MATHLEIFNLAVEQLLKYGALVEAAAECAVAE